MNINQYQQSQQIPENSLSQQQSHILNINNKPQPYQIKVIQSPLIKTINHKYENKLSLQNESSKTQLPKIESRSTCISQESRQKKNQKAVEAFKPDLNQILESQLQNQFYQRNNFLLKTAKSDNQNNNLILDLTQTSLSFSQRCNSSNYDKTLMANHNNSNKLQLLDQNEITKINNTYLQNENLHTTNFITTHSNLPNFDSKYGVDTHDNESLQQQIMSSTTSHFENYHYDSKNIRVTENKLSESQFHQIQSQFQSQNQQQFSKQKKHHKDEKIIQQTVNRIKKKFFGLQLNKLEKIQEKSSFLQNSNSRNIFKESNRPLNTNNIINQNNNQDSEELQLSIKSNSMSPKISYQLDYERPSLELSFSKQEHQIKTPNFQNKNQQQNEQNLFLMKKVKLRINSNNNRFSRSNNHNNNNNLITDKNNKSNLNLIHQNSNDNQMNNSISNNNSINNIIINTNKNNNNISGVNKSKKLILSYKKNDPQCNQQQQQIQQSAKQKIRKGITIAKNNNHNQQSSSSQNNNNNQKQSNINQIQLSIEDFPFVTANSWCVFNAQKKTYLFGKKALQQVEIASLTKIMTALVVCKFIQRLKLDTYKFHTLVSNNSVVAGGTTAQLQQGDILNINDLLHGLMLPSGNDAAIALAEYIGYLLLLEDNQKVKQKNIPEIMIVPELKQEEATQKFLKEMNKVGVAAGMERSHFASVHGMMNRLNISTARDVAILTCAAQEDNLFNNIVKTQKYIGKTYKFQQKYLLEPENLQSFSQLTKNKQEKLRAEQILEFNRQIEWNNTNKLLYMDTRFDGVKTGITDTAGACLCSSFKVKKPNGNLISIIIVILSSRTMEDRWEDSKLITKWSLKRYFNYIL